MQMKGDSSQMTGKPTKLFNLSFIELMFISFATSLGYSMISPLMSSYSVSVGASLTQAGIVAGAFSIAALVLRPFGGFFSDHFNKKYLLVFTTILFTLCFLGYSVCHTVLSLTAIRMIHGAAFGINSTVNLALATEFIPDDRMGEGIGFFGIGQVVSQVIGPTIGMWIRDRCGFTVLFLGAAGLVFFSAMVILAGFGYRPEGGAGVRLTEDISLKSFRPGNLIAKECILYALIGGLFSVGNGVTSNFLVLIGEERGIANISLFFVINASVLFLLRLTIGKVLDRASLLWVVNLSLAVSGAAMLLIGCSPILVPILIAAVLKAFGNVGGQISLQAACVKKVDAARIGIATSTYYIGADLGNGLGPILAGKIADLSDYRFMFLCIAALFGIGMIIFSLYERGKEGQTLEKENA